MSGAWQEDNMITSSPALPDAQELDFWHSGPERDVARLPILPQDVAEETPLQKLTRYWMNERHAPDILPAQDMLLGRLLDHIEKQVRIIAAAFLGSSLQISIRASR